MPLSALENLERDALASLQNAADQDAVEAWRLAFLGPKGKVRAALASIKDVPPTDRPAFGQRANEVRQRLEDALASRRPDPVDKPQGPALDMTEPGLLQAQAIGRTHIITRVRAELGWLAVVPDDAEVVRV